MTRLLLVHGAFHGAWCWDRLVPELASAGVAAEAVELPFSSPREDTATVAAAVDRLSADGDKVVVLGHSYGGTVISRAARRAAHLVYLAAVMTAPGEMAATGETPGMAAIVLDGATASVAPAAARDAFYHRCPPDTVEWATRRLRPMPAADFASPGCEDPAWQSVPSTYVICTEDQTIAPAAQAHMARHAKATARIASDHSPFLSCPAELASLLQGIVAAV